MNADYWSNNNDPYLYPNSNVLRNISEIKDAEKLEKFEQNVTEINALDAAEYARDRNINFVLWLEIHRLLFKEIFQWAGEIRNVQMAKDNVVFAHPENINSEAKIIFDKLESDNYLQNIDKDVLSKKLAYYFTELNALHPFREGNGRSQKLLINELVRQLGHKVAWNKITSTEHMEAVKSGFFGSNKKLENLFKKIIERENE